MPMIVLILHDLSTLPDRLNEKTERLWRFENRDLKYAESH